MVTFFFSLGPLSSRQNAGTPSFPRKLHRGWTGQNEMENGWLTAQRHPWLTLAVPAATQYLHSASGSRIPSHPRSPAGRRQAFSRPTRC